MSEFITSHDLAELAASAKFPLPTQIVADHDKFIVKVTIEERTRVVAAIEKGSRMHERKFPTLGAVGAFLLKSNIRQYQVDMGHYTPPVGETRAPRNQARMRDIHKLAQHTAWLRKEVEESRASPLVSNEDAIAMFDANIARARAQKAVKA